jgi:ribonuclease VapC
MSEFALDASAVIAVLLRERGGEIVQPLLSRASIATVNLAEVVSHFAKKTGNDAEIREMIGNLQFKAIPFDEALAYEAGLLIRSTRAAGLSLGDRACLALARRLGAKVLTADRAWSRVASAVGVEVELIR